MDQGLSDIERRALVLARVYEKVRREHGQFGYRIFGREGFVDSPLFRQFVTVVEWLHKQQWNVSWGEVHWRGYVEFCFEKLSPTVPQPGQLKNLFFLGKYIKSQVLDKEVGVSSLSVEELERLYRLVVREDLRPYLKALGLEGFRFASEHSGGR